MSSKKVKTESSFQEEDSSLSKITTSQVERLKSIKTDDEDQESTLNISTSSEDYFDDTDPQKEKETSSTSSSEGRGYVPKDKKKTVLKKKKKETSSTSNPEFRGYVPKDKKKTVLIKEKKKETSSTSSPEGRGYVPKDKKKTVPFKYDDRENYEDLVKRGFIDPNDGLFTPEMFVYPKTWEEARTGRRNFSRMPTGSSTFDTCVLCSKPPENGMQHECGAVCCFKCWKSQIFEGPEDRKCPNPQCSARVKRKHLKPVKYLKKVNRCTASTSATSGDDE